MMIQENRVGYSFSCWSEPVSFACFLAPVLRGGSSGRVHGCAPLPHWDDLQFSNTTRILPKKENYVVYWCWKGGAHPPWYFIMKFKSFDLCIIIDLVFSVTHCFINSIHFVSPTSSAFNRSVNKEFTLVKRKSHLKRLDCTILIELILVSIQGSEDKGLCHFTRMEC